MKTFRALAAAAAVATLASCGYHLGGMKAPAMENMNTFCVEMFANETEHPNAGVLMTTAMANTLQSDGTFRMAPRKEADFVVKGNVCKIERDSMITNTEDTYISTQIGVRVEVEYQIVDMKNGRVLLSSQTSEEGNFFNEVGNKESAFEAAVSYATRRIADEITTNLVTR
ncbi:MAG: hypothetical protein IKV13_04805 [Akkermansia sp.]|nr:hypothetical protein [Akkermansia sp.]